MINIKSMPTIERIQLLEQYPIQDLWNEIIRRDCEKDTLIAEYRAKIREFNDREDDGK